MSKRLSKIVGQAAELNQLRSQVMDILRSTKGESGQKFDFTIPVPNVVFSLNEIDARIMAILGLIEQMSVKSGEVLLPDTFLHSLEGNLNQLNHHYQEITSEFTKINNDGGPGSLDSDQFVLISRNGRQKIRINNQFENLFQASDGALADYYALSDVLKGESFDKFSVALNEFSKQMSYIQKTRDQLTEIHSESEKAGSGVQKVLDSTKGAYNEISRLNAESEKDKKTLSEYLGEGTEKISGIRSIAEESGQLKNLVDGYQNSFDNFQKRLDERETALKSGNVRQDALIKSLEEKEKTISDLNARAEDMLTGATVAGLAGAYGELRDKLSEQVTRAQRAFYCSIAFLLLSAMPLAGHIFPEWGPLSDGDASNVIGASMTDFFSQTASRVLLVLPALLCVRFTAKRHTSLFRLKEDYEYKYSLAVSVDAFKKQAKNFEHEITAATFAELTFNPADRMNSKGDSGRRYNKTMKALLKKLDPTHEED